MLEGKGTFKDEYDSVSAFKSSNFLPGKITYHDIRFGMIRKEGRKNIGSGRKRTALRLFVGRWVL